jgi:hypothetical protein
MQSNSTQPNQPRFIMSAQNLFNIIAIVITFINFSAYSLITTHTSRVCDFNFKSYKLSEGSISVLSRSKLKHRRLIDPPLSILDDYFLYLSPLCRNIHQVFSSHHLRTLHVTQSASGCFSSCFLPILPGHPMNSRWGIEYPFKIARASCGIQSFDDK